MAPVKRGWLGALIDRLFAWSNGLRPESNTYTIEDLRIPIGDGTQFPAHLYRPVGADPIGTLLVRSSYGLGLQLALTHARVFAARGYQVLFSCCRGTGGADGDLDPGRGEAEDGQAVVAWMRKQSWYTGSFATLGTSYLGYVQWALLSNPPPDMKPAILHTGQHDLSQFIWGTGALDSSIIAWADLMSVMARGVGFISLMLHVRSQKRRLRSGMDSLPLLPVVDAHMEHKAPTWLAQSITKPDLTDPYWKPLQQGEALDRVNIPVFLVTGWHDLMLGKVMTQYSKLVERGVTVGLTIGPWTHLQAGGRATVKAAIDWLDEHYAARTKGGRPSSVRAFLTGSGDWRALPRWPPPSSPHELYLTTGKKQSLKPPPADSTKSQFNFDPANPTPSVVVPELLDNGPGGNEDTPLAARSVVVTFVTQPLDIDLEVCGKPSVELYHSSDNPHVDLLVLVSEVDGKGRSHTIAERYLRLDPKRAEEPLHLDLHDCGHRFRKGNRIRLLVAGGSHPRYIRNLGTGENQGTGSTTRPALHTVQHHASAASKLILPVTR